MRDKLWCAERDEIHEQDLETRKQEWEQKKKVKALQKTKQTISSELQMSISDSEIVWKINQKKSKKLFLSSQFNEIDEKDEKEIEIIVNTANNESL